MKPNNLIYLKCMSFDDFCKTWVAILTPFHHLTSRERDVAARIISQYFKLRQKVQDPEVLRDLLWSKSSRQDMMKSLKMSSEHFQMKLGKLRKAEFIIDNDINPRYLPHTSDEPRSTLLIAYDWSSVKKPIQNAGA